VTSPTLIRWPSRIVTGALILMIRAYHHTLSPWLGNVCRFEPSCSRYMIGSLKKYGLIKGFLKGCRRLLRCHPWNPGGYDPP
jgi:uncharacterized protein